MNEANSKAPEGSKYKPKMRKLNSQNRLLSLSNCKPNIDSNAWVIHIRNFFEENEEVDEHESNGEESSICVYSIPRSLRLLKPEVYSPQFIALGPYHHWRQDLYEMERFKLICAKKVQKSLSCNLKFEDLVKKLSNKEYEIRGCYHKHLDIEGEALAWMMAIDGLFLLEFLNIYANLNNSNDPLPFSSTRMTYLVNAMGKKLAYDAILKDIMMLENQLPTFVLKKILRIQCASAASRELADNLLHPMMTGVCRELSPLALNEAYPLSEAVKCAHLLDLLYHLIVPKLEQEVEGEIVQDMLSPNNREEELPLTDDQTSGVFTNTWELASKLNFKPMKKFTKFLELKPLRLLAGLPIKLMSKLPIISALAPVLENMFLGNDNSEKGSVGKDEEVPLVEEIMVPSVENLYNAGIQFWPTNGDISTIDFDSKAKRFYLPVVHLDGNTEVILRNLVAYEASSVTGPLVLARYTELMNGIIDTPKDVEILRRSKIIVSRLKSDKQVADLWNGMTLAMRLTKVGYIDKAIEEANKYHANTLKIKCHRLMKAYVYGSWRFLIVLATICLLGLMSIQAFCSVYSCPRFFNIIDSPPPPPET